MIIIEILNVVIYFFIFFKKVNDWLQQFFLKERFFGFSIQMDEWKEKKIFLIDK
jgi:hypothetical protein